MDKIPGSAFRASGQSTNPVGSMLTLDDHRQAMQRELDSFFAKGGKGEGLTRPVLSDELVGRLQHVKGREGFLWSTDPKAGDPYTEMDNYIRKFLANHNEEFVLVGLTGNPMSRASNGYSVCYVTGDVACFFQFRWGNVNDDKQMQISLMDAYLYHVRLVETYIKEAKDTGLELPGERLLLVLNQYSPDRGAMLPKFCWVQAEDHDLEALDTKWKVGKNASFMEIENSIPGGPHKIPDHLKAGQGGRSVEQGSK